MDVIKEMVKNNYARRRSEFFDILDEAITDAIVEKGIRFEPVDVNEQFDKYKGSLILNRRFSHKERA